jgi:hypothetical protein
MCKDKAMKKIFLLTMFVIMLTACAPDPRDAADATTVQADQAAADAELARIEKQRLADYEAQRKEAAAAELDAGIQTFIRYATLAAVLVVIALAVSLSITLRDIGRGAGLAAVTAMELKAHLIPLDPITRQYPLLLQSIGKGQFSLTNPNTDSVLILDTRKDGDRLMILAMARTQATGSLARESRLSLAPGEVSRIDLSALEVIE